MAYESRDYETDLRWMYYVGVAIIILGVIFFRPKPTPPPANSTVYGCYANPVAPSIKLDVQGMTINQSAFPRIRFHMERHKTGIALTADAPIAADRVGERYLYSINSVGEGWYLDFYTIINQRRYGVFDDHDLDRFTMLAQDGTYLAYEKSAPSQCVTG